jgi:2',3'-cyclic-nucleotide 2'-phosphodiesterase (5'-nucleotidase family)
MRKPNVFARFAALLLFLGLCLPLAQAEIRSLTILHTNDLHARLLPLDNGQGGFARLATALARERGASQACLVLNAGDLVQGSPVSTIFRGLPVYEIANLFGFDAATLGNHEFDYGWQIIPRYLKTARYPVVVSNLVDGAGKRMTDKPYVILNAAGLRVAVIGALTADLPTLTTPKMRGDWRILPVVDTVRRYVAEVRPQADLIVLLAHLSPAEETEALHQLDEVSVIVSGHAHKGLEAPIPYRGRVLVRVNAYGAEFGRLDLKVDTAAKRMVSYEHKRIPVDAATPPSERVATLVAKWEAEVAKIVDVPIGEAVQAFPRPKVRALMERAMAEMTGSQFAFINAGGVRDALPQGRLMARHVWNIMPFDNKVVVGTFKGRQLPPAVTRGRQVDPDRDYRFVTSDFNAANQNAPGGFGTTGLVFPEEGVLLRDLFIDWIKKQQVLRPAE